MYVIQVNKKQLPFLKRLRFYILYINRKYSLSDTRIICTPAPTPHLLFDTLYTVKCENSPPDLTSICRSNFSHLKYQFVQSFRQSPPKQMKQNGDIQCIPSPPLQCCAHPITRHFEPTLNGERGLFHLLLARIVVKPVQN